MNKTHLSSDIQQQIELLYILRQLLNIATTIKILIKNEKSQRQGRNYRRCNAPRPQHHHIASYLSA